MSKIEAYKKLASQFRNPEDAKSFLDKLLGGVDDIKPLDDLSPAEFEELDFAKKAYNADANRRKLPVTPENMNDLIKDIPTEIPRKTPQDLELDALERDIIKAGVNPSKLKVAGIGGAVAAGSLLTPSQSEAAPMSRFKTLLSGIDEVAPQIKGTLKEWGEELNTLRANPAGNEKRMQQLSDNIKSTVEANAKRSAPDVKKAAMAIAMKNPFEDEAGNNRDPLEELNKATENTGKNLVDRFMGDSSPENKAFAERAFRNIANPMNLVGGVGLADAAMGAVDTLIPDGTLDKGIKRFKGLLDK